MSFFVEFCLEVALILIWQHSIRTPIANLTILGHRIVLLLLEDTNKELLIFCDAFLSVQFKSLVVAIWWISRFQLRLNYLLLFLLHFKNSLSLSINMRKLLFLAIFLVLLISKVLHFKRWLNRSLPLSIDWKLKVDLVFFSLCNCWILRNLNWKSSWFILSRSLLNGCYYAIGFCAFFSN